MPLRLPFLALLAAAPAMAASAPATPEPTATIAADRDAGILVGKLTLDEKIALVNGHFGSVLKKTNPGDRRIGAGYVAGISRLGIPALYESDGSLGIGNGGSMRPGDVATAMPSGQALAASFDPALAEAAGAIMGGEARAKGFNVLLAGGANLIRDPWAGRNFEYLSEDVLLTGTMAGAQIRGIQTTGTIATIKHYALNAQESGRYVMDARIDEAALRESDLLAFEIGMERGRPGSVMCGYNKIGGDWACENPFLLDRVLKQDWKFPGWVMSDWGAVHSTAKAAIAGLDQESGQELDSAPFFVGPLKDAVQSRTVPMARLDDMVRRILRTMAVHDLFDRPAPATPQPIDYAAHGEMARRVAEAGIVLLKNDAGLLPAARTARRVVVIGGHADIGVLSGGGSSQVQASSGTPLRLPMPDAPASLSFIKITYQGSAPLAAIRARLPGADVAFVDGGDIAAATARAKDADLVLLFAEQWRTETRDLETLALDGRQDELIAAVAKANPRTVVVLESGGAVLMPWLGQVGAVLAAWYPGDRGGEAIARVLFGEVDAAGRLPISFPARDGQSPRPTVPGLAAVKAAAALEKDKPATKGATTVDLSGGVVSFPVTYTEGADTGYRWYERSGERPLFPFGFGLSYTRFDYGDLKVTPGAQPSVSFTVTNRGARKGADVPQVYAAVTARDGKAIRRLVGFASIRLAAGESRTLTLPIEPRLLANYDVGGRAWRIAAGTIPVSIGRNAADQSLSGTLTMPALSIAP